MPLNHNRSLSRPLSYASRCSRAANHSRLPFLVRSCPHARNAVLALDQATVAWVLLKIVSGCLADQHAKFICTMSVCTYSVDHLNPHFIQFLLSLIERPEDTVFDEEVTAHAANLLVAINVHMDLTPEAAGPDEHLVRIFKHRDCL